MLTTHFRNQFNLHSQKVAFIFVLTACSFFTSNLLAQKSRQVNLMNYDYRKLHYGFQIGFFNSFMHVRHSDEFTFVNDSVFAVDAINSGGFSLGLITNIALKDELWNFRFTPNFAFYQHQVDFTFSELEDADTVLTTESNIIETTMLELPLLFMFKSRRRLNTRMYMLGGLTYSMQLGGRQDETTQNTILLQRQNLEITYGFGFHFYMQMFNLAPELRFSHGLLNMLNQNNNPFSSNIERLTTHKITLFLQFEG